jgi:hypothetical protein
MLGLVIEVRRRKRLHRHDPDPCVLQRPRRASLPVEAGRVAIPRADAVPADIGSGRTPGIGEAVHRRRCDTGGSGSVVHSGRLDQVSSRVSRQPGKAASMSGSCDIRAVAPDVLDVVASKAVRRPARFRSTDRWAGVPPRRPDRRNGAAPCRMPVGKQGLNSGQDEDVHSASFSRTCNPSGWFAA